MITPDETPTFPNRPSFGLVVSPEYLVSVIKREGGHERRDRKWDKPLLRFKSVPLEHRTPEDIEAAINFYHAMGGREKGFRMKDWSDWKSCSITEEPTQTDQPLVEIETTDTYQLTKQYTIGPFSQNRDITKPVGSTILIANELGVLQPDNRWDLDEATGILTPNNYFAGTPTAWGGEFDIYVRFDSELDIEIEGYEVVNYTLIMQELRSEE